MSSLAEYKRRAEAADAKIVELSAALMRLENNPAASAPAAAPVVDLQAQIDAAALAVREVKAKIKAKEATKDDLKAPLANLLALKEHQKNGTMPTPAAAPTVGTAQSSGDWIGKLKTVVASLVDEDDEVRNVPPCVKKKLFKVSLRPTLQGCKKAGRACSGSS